MLIVDSQTDGRESGWTDPLVDVHIEQFRTSLEEMTDVTLPDDIDSAYELAKLLCDTSRQIVYRLHRVTHEQLSALREVFEDARTCIDRLNLEDVEHEKRELITGFAFHIGERAERLARLLES